MNFSHFIAIVLQHFPIPLHRSSFSLKCPCLLTSTHTHALFIVIYPSAISICNILNTTYHNTSFVQSIFLLENKQCFNFELRPYFTCTRRKLCAHCLLNYLKSALFCKVSSFHFTFRPIVPFSCGYSLLQTSTLSSHC